MGRNTQRSRVRSLKSSFAKHTSTSFLYNTVFLIIIWIRLTTCICSKLMIGGWNARLSHHALETSNLMYHHGANNRQEFRTPIETHIKLFDPCSPHVPLHMSNSVTSLLVDDFCVIDVYGQHMKLHLCALQIERRGQTSSTYHKYNPELDTPETCPSSNAWRSHARQSLYPYHPFEHGCMPKYPRDKCPASQTQRQRCREGMLTWSIHFFNCFYEKKSHISLGVKNAFFHLSV